MTENEDRKLVTDYLGEKPQNEIVIPADVVLRRAPLLNSTSEEANNDHWFSNGTPFSLGIEVAGERVSTIIRRFTPIPVSAQRTYCTTCDNQTTVRISIYKGESKKVWHDMLLAKLKINGITPMAKGKVLVNVRFEMDSNGILTIAATESSKNLTEYLSFAT